MKRIILALTILSSPAFAVKQIDLEAELPGICAERAEKNASKPPRAANAKPLRPSYFDEKCAKLQEKTLHKEERQKAKMEKLFDRRRKAEDKLEFLNAKIKECTTDIDCSLKNPGVEE